MIKVLGSRAANRVKKYCENIEHFDEMLEDLEDSQSNAVFPDEAYGYLGTAQIAADSLIKRLKRLRSREADLWYEECKRLKIIKEETGE